jgi:hypothetical protein
VNSELDGVFVSTDGEQGRALVDVTGVVLPQCPSLKIANLHVDRSPIEQNIDPGGRPVQGGERSLRSQ